jgi:hypothetical protein
MSWAALRGFVLINAFVVTDESLTISRLIVTDLKSSLARATKNAFGFLPEKLDRDLKRSAARQKLFSSTY